MMASTGLRIAVANWSSRRVGGIEEYLSILIPKLHTSGHAVAFCYERDTPRDRDRIALPSNVADICVDAVGADAAVEALRRWRPDVIYAHGLVDVMLERRLQDIAPSVFFLHTYTGTCISGGKTFTRPTVVACDRTFGWPCLAHFFPHGCGGRSPVTMWRQFQHQSSRLAVMRRYSAILTHSAHMQTEMARHGLHVDVVPYPVEAPAAPTDMPGRDDRWKLLFAGRMDFLKGARFLLDAIPTVAAAIGRPIAVTLAGDGQQRQALEARAREIEAANISTSFPGWLPQESIGALMKAADLLVVPSVWPEPFGSVGPAAAHYGVPAAAFSVGGIPGWLTEDVSGHLAPANPPTAEGLAQAIIRCLENPDHYAALRAGAREMSSRFTMARHLPPLMAHLARAAASPAARPA